MTPSTEQIRHDANAFILTCLITTARFLCHLKARNEQFWVNSWDGCGYISDVMAAKDTLLRIRRDPSSIGAVPLHRIQRVTVFPLANWSYFPLKRNFAEGLSAFQANSFGPWRNKPAKRAHPLCSNFRDPWSEGCQQRCKGLPCGRQPPTQRRTKRFHEFTFAGLSADCPNPRQPHNDRAGSGILCRIAHIALLLPSTISRESGRL